MADEANKLIVLEVDADLFAWLSAKATAAGQDPAEWISDYLNDVREFDLGEMETREVPREATQSAWERLKLSIETLF